MKTKHCQHCGKLIAEDADFCANCGEKQSHVVLNPSQNEAQSQASYDNLQSPYHRGRIENNPNTYYIWGLIFGTLSFILLPPLFGGIAAYWGSQLEKVPDYRQRGHFIFVFGLVGLVVGMIFGIFMERL